MNVWRNQPEILTTYTPLHKDAMRFFKFSGFVLFRSSEWRWNYFLSKRRLCSTFIDFTIEAVPCRKGYCLQLLTRCTLALINKKKTVSSNRSNWENTSNCGNRQLTIHPNEINLAMWPIIAHCFVLCSMKPYGADGTTRRRLGQINSWWCTDGRWFD